ncbi:MAG: hypothetical protein NW205_02985, partial [Hyphomicrobiaceae bacterium]|nr:hypothetical protein [Hyphomicrobiaceae bacterium]
GRKGGGDGGDDAAATAGPSQITARDQADNARQIAKQQEELAEYERSLKVEKARNVDLAVAGFISELRTLHKNLLGDKSANVRSASGLEINQVTAGQIKAAVEKSYGDARLGDYDAFAGELWTKDRLTVRILHVAEGDLAPYFDGVGARGPSMDDIEALFAKSARFVYAEALEVAEIIGVSHSFDRFIRTIYEQSADTPGSLWTTGADGHYERLVSGVIDSVPREQFIAAGTIQSSDPLGLEKQFQFRFRARRALYDCLASNYGNITRGGKTITVAAGSPADAALPAPPQTRGASLAKKPGEPGLVPVATSGGTAAAAPLDQNASPETVWRAAQGYVRDVCRGPVVAVANSASTQGLRPVPARFDSSGGFAPSGKPALPAGLR